MSAPPPTEEMSLSIDGRRLWLVGAALGALLVVPLLVALGLSWVDAPRNAAASRAVPDWVALPQLRATTRDGTVVRARVALDVPGTLLKANVQHNLQQVGLLLELSVAARSRAELTSPQGIAALSTDMRERVNDYLGIAPGETGVASVAIQDLLVKPQ